MRHAGNQLAYRGHVFARQKLLLRAPQIFVSQSRLLIQNRAIDSIGNLAAHCDQEIDVRGREFPRSPAADYQSAEHTVLRPQNHHKRGLQPFIALRFSQNRGDGQALRGKKRRVNSLDVLQQLRLHLERRNVTALLGALPHRRDAPQRQGSFIHQVKRRRVQAKQLGHLPQRALNGVVEVQRFGKRLADGVQHHQLAIAPPDFLLRSFAVGYVQQESLQGGQITRGVSYGNG